MAAKNTDAQVILASKGWTPEVLEELRKEPEAQQKAEKKKRKKGV